jgi:hypothetical protein
MGAQSDFVSESIKPNPQHEAEQMNRARLLMGLGIAPDQIAEMLSLPVDVLLSLQQHTKD